MLKIFTEEIGNKGERKDMVKLDPEEMYKALVSLYYAGLFMPRHTPAPGGASDEHTFSLPASSVWSMDLAMKKVAKLLELPDPTLSCCVGSVYFEKRSFSSYVQQQCAQLSRSVTPEN